MSDENWQLEVYTFRRRFKVLDLVTESLILNPVFLVLKVTATWIINKQICCEHSVKYIGNRTLALIRSVPSLALEGSVQNSVSFLYPILNRDDTWPNQHLNHGLLMFFSYFRLSVLNLYKNLAFFIRMLLSCIFMYG